MATLQADAPILLYDGSCGFCARSVQFVLAHEGSRHDLRFAPLAGETGRRVREAYPALEGIESMVWVEPPRAPLARSAAVIRTARYLGGGWSLVGALGSLVPRPIRDWVYRQVARHRHRIAGPLCLIPTAEQRPRFLD